MRTNIPTPKEFSWHLARPECIETTRKEQYLPNCWAVSLASCIGDNFCLTENITAIYPSSIWITSLKNEYLRTHKQPLQLKYTSTMTEEFIDFFANSYYIALERCYGGKTTYSIVLNEFIDNGGYVNLFDFRKDVLETILTPELFPNCCENCLDTDREYKSPKYFCSTTSECIDEPDKFKIELTDDVLFFYRGCYKNSMSKAIIKFTQNTIKNMLCSGPINSISFTVTKEYITYCQRQVNNTTVEVFHAKIINAQKNNHAIEILGWGSESNVEFWYIKDSNFPSFFLKIAFTTMGNRRGSIGPDLCKFILNTTDYFVTYCYSIKPKALDAETKQKLIKNGLIERAKPRDAADLMYSIV